MCRDDEIDTTMMVSTLYSGYQANNYTQMSAAECLKYYDANLISNFRNLIVIVQEPPVGSNMSQCGYNGTLWNTSSSVIAIDVNVLPAGWLDQFWEPFQNSPSAEQLIQEVDSTGTWSLGSYAVQSCEAESIGASLCELQFVSYILYVVVGCNLVKFLCMCAAARYLWNLDEPILATIGDAVSSFLDNPDETTKGICLLDHQDVGAKVWKRAKNDPTAYNPMYRRKMVRRLYSTTSHRRWWTTVILCTLYLILGFVLWALSWRDLSGLSFSQTMKLSFGAVDSGLVLGLSGASGLRLIVDVIVANSFQVALSTTYFLYNSLYTAQCAALEWASYIQGKRKSLRVTWPRGQQRSTYYLQLPYRYGIPLTALLILMHFLISQSIFLARLQYYDWQGQPTYGGFSDVGFSPRATLTTCLVGAVMILAQVAHACRPLDNRIPMHGNKSAVMSAMCHPEPPDDGSAKLRRYTSNQGDINNSIATKPITWGVTRKPVDSAFSSSVMLSGPLAAGGDGAGHCSFAADMVELPEIGRSYR